MWVKCHEPKATLNISMRNAPETHFRRAIPSSDGKMTANPNIPIKWKKWSRVGLRRLRCLSERRVQLDRDAASRAALSVREMENITTINRGDGKRSQGFRGKQRLVEFLEKLGNSGSKGNTM